MHALRLKKCNGKSIKTGIFTGRHFLFYAKVGGEMQLINVIAAGEPFEAVFGKGRRIVKIPVFGFGFSGDVPLKHLYTMEKNNG